MPEEYRVLELVRSAQGLLEVRFVRVPGGLLQGSVRKVVRLNQGRKGLPLICRALRLG